MAQSSGPILTDGSASVSASAEPAHGLLDLPHELLELILLSLPTHSAVKLGVTCRKFEKALRDDMHWRKRFLSLNLPHSGVSPFPYDNWKELYLTHYPYWFIPERKIWYADGTEVDGGFCGQLVIARYNPHTGSIDGCQLLGEQGHSSIYPWPERPGVNIHSFHPKVRLHLAQPVIRLRKEGAEASLDAGSSRGSHLPADPNPVGLRSLRSAGNDLNRVHNVHAQVMLARSISPELQHPSMRLWPPDRLPATDRVRRQTPSIFRSHAKSYAETSAAMRGTTFDRPTKHSEVCQNAFRFRKQVGGRVAALYEMLSHGGGFAGVDVGGAMLSLAGGVATYATLPEDAYTPTRERPYQGLWVGDYAGHGCEFLLVRQKITKQEIANSEDISPKHHSLELEPFHHFFEDLTGPEEDGEEDVDSPWSDTSDESGEEDTQTNVPFSGTSHDPTSVDESEPKETRRHKRRRFYSASEGVEDGPVGETGRLEAIKLTGDPNIPRGEFTFVAEEIGPKGQLYVATTDVFKDKRAVHCWGHIAAHGFADDVFVKTSLILVDHNTLAQHWHEFGHVAFYRRVDVDRFFDPNENVELSL